jgi:hypothetical protein
MYFFSLSARDSYEGVDIDTRWGAFEAVVVCFELVYMFSVKPACELPDFWGSKVCVFSTLVDAEVPLVIYFEKSVCEIEMISHRKLLLTLWTVTALVRSCSSHPQLRGMWHGHLLDWLPCHVDLPCSHRLDLTCTSKFDLFYAHAIEFPWGINLFRI